MIRDKHPAPPTTLNIHPINYWLDLFTGTTWGEFRKSGSTISGFRKRMRNAASKVRPGDILLCYLTAIPNTSGLESRQTRLTGPSTGQFMSKGRRTRLPSP
ncbi:hypothetical protein ASA1KI_31400 [Opitutales bacterium ASA1]|nr:hypothetical protein ASA1KI_31400 [Opitutales bacterium ASA1]